MQYINNYFMVNNNELLDMTMSVRYNKITYKKHNIDTHTIKDIQVLNDFGETKKILLLLNNGMKLVDKDIINVNTDPLKNYNINNIKFEDTYDLIKIKSQIGTTNDKFISYCMKLFCVSTWDHDQIIYNATILDNVCTLNYNDMIEQKSIKQNRIKYYDNKIKRICYDIKTVVFASEFQKYGINIKDIKKIWIMDNIAEGLCVIDDENSVEHYQFNYELYEKRYMIISDDLVREGTKSKDTDYMEKWMTYDARIGEFVLLNDGTIYWCNFMKKDFVLDKVGKFNVGTKIFPLCDYPNYTILLVDKMNIHKYNVHRGLTKILTDINLSWFDSKKFDKIKFTKEMFFSCGDKMKQLFNYLLLCLKWSQYSKKIPKYLLINIFEFIYCDIFL